MSHTPALVFSCLITAAAVVPEWLAHLLFPPLATSNTMVNLILWLHSIPLPPLYLVWIVLYCCDARKISYDMEKTKTARRAFDQLHNLLQDQDVLVLWFTSPWASVHVCVNKDMRLGRLMEMEMMTDSFLRLRLRISTKERDGNPVWSCERKKISERRLHFDHFFEFPDERGKTWIRVCVQLHNKCIKTSKVDFLLKW